MVGVAEGKTWAAKLGCRISSHQGGTRSRMWARLTHLFLWAPGLEGVGSTPLVGVTPPSRREETRKVGGEVVMSWTRASTKRPGSMRRATFIPTVTWKKGGNIEVMLGHRIVEVKEILRRKALVTKNNFDAMDVTL